MATQGRVFQIDLESAILISREPGNYTAIVKGADGGVGNALVEIYKLAP